MDTGTLVVSLGVVVTAIVGINELIARLQERSDLQIITEYFLGVGPSFRVTIIKHGKRAIFIEDVVLSFKPDDKFSYREVRSRNINLNTDVPQTFQENDPPLRFSFSLFFLREDNSLNPLDIKRVEVKTLGKSYKFPKLSLRSSYKFYKLKRQIRVMLSDPNKGDAH